MLALGAGLAQSMPGRPPSTRTVSTRKSKPGNRSAQQKEIDAWNEAVDQRKAEKKARKWSME